MTAGETASPTNLNPTHKMNTKEESRGKYFVLASEEVKNLCQDLVVLYHSDLDSAAAKIDIVFAFRDPDGEEPAMEKEGHRMLGKSSTLSLKDRVKGMGDVEIILDGDAWHDMDLRKRMALLDHQLEHFEVKRDKVGNFIFDDLERPIIKMRNHDRRINFFDNVARRHRSDSMEVHQLQRLFAEAGQIYLPFVDKEGELTDPDVKVTMSVNNGPEVDVTKKFNGLKRKGESK